MPDVPATWPRGMPIETAATYCGVGTGTLSTYGPKPIRVGIKRLVWLREDLDAWLDRLAGRAPALADNRPWSEDDGEDNAALRPDLQRAR